MPGRELESTERAVRLVMEKGWSCYQAAEKYGLSHSAVYAAIRRRDPKWFQKNPLRRVV